MSVRRLWITILLILPLLFVQKPIAAQNYTTITNPTTLTNQTTLTAYSVYVSDTIYSTTFVSPTLLDSTVQVSAPQPHTCHIEFVRFDAEAHVQVTGAITATSNIHVYVVDAASATAWLSGEELYCDVAVVTPVFLNLGPGKSFGWKWTPPADGTYWFFVENSDSSNSPTVHLLLTSEPVATTEASYVYATAQSTIVGTRTETTTSYQTQEIQNVLPSMGNTTWIMLLAVVIIIAVIAVLLVRTRGKARTTAGQCAKCGAELPRKAKFCKKCGAPVE